MEPIDFGCGWNLNEHSKAKDRYSISRIREVIAKARSLGIPAIATLRYDEDSEDGILRKTNFNMAALLGTGAKKMIYESYIDSDKNSSMPKQLLDIEFEMRDSGMLKVIEGSDDVRMYSGAHVISYCSKEAIKYFGIVSPLKSECVDETSIGVLLPRANLFRDTFDSEIASEYTSRGNSNVVPIRLITMLSPFKNQIERDVVAHLREIGSQDAIEAIARITLDLEI
jgi:hypothetical protein